MSDLTPEQALARYRELVAKVDAAFDAIHARRRSAMKCGRGCSACCKPGLTVCAVEHEGIAKFLAEHSEVVPSDRTDACAMLAPDGSCQIYPVRPLVCRSHGAPLAFKVEGEARRDVCPLNFTAESLEGLPAEDCLNLDTLNTLLALINKAFAPTASLARYPLARP